MKHLLPIICILSLASCAWLKDDLDECPVGFWLNLRYTYNILDAEAAPKQVTDAYIYVYDKDGNFVKRIYATHDELVANAFSVRIDDLPEDDYQFVVWSGIGNSMYSVVSDAQTIGDFRFSLANAGGNCAAELPALLQGWLPTVHYSNQYTVHEVQLKKNTNHLACLVVTVPDNPSITTADYTLKVTADNGMMDAYSNIVPSGTTTYVPYSGESVVLDETDYGNLHGVKFGLTTLRLMNDGNARIILQNNKTGRNVFNISFSEYVGMIGKYYTNLGREIDEQEYLDRQDFYTFVFYISGDLDQLIQLQVNNWRMRVINHLKL